ncbi:hypothetical protein CASFOL_001706 [Castilleja foliolosa]|uniref:Uncharacterized protein n=1 Tax=Castilleja foliolosa TaxID=1961234 RepID=A0ABD3ECB5_9LAMI
MSDEEREEKELDLTSPEALQLVLSECKPKVKIVDLCENGDAFIRDSHHGLRNCLENGLIPSAKEMNFKLMQLFMELLSERFSGPQRRHSGGGFSPTAPGECKARKNDDYGALWLESVLLLLDDGGSCFCRWGVGLRERIHDKIRFGFVRMSSVVEGFDLIGLIVDLKCTQVWQMEWDMSGMTLASTGSDGVVRLWQSNVNGEWHEQAILTPTS